MSARPSANLETICESTHVPDGPLMPAGASTSPHESWKPTRAHHWSTLSAASSPFQNGSGSLSTAIALISPPGPLRGGRHRMCKALGYAPKTNKVRRAFALGAQGATGSPNGNRYDISCITGDGGTTT